MAALTLSKPPVLDEETERAMDTLVRYVDKGEYYLGTPLSVAAMDALVLIRKKLEEARQGGAIALCDALEDRWGDGIIIGWAREWLKKI